MVLSIGTIIVCHFSSPSRYGFISSKVIFLGVDVGFLVMTGDLLGVDVFEIDSTILFPDLFSPDVLSFGTNGAIITKNTIKPMIDRMILFL